VTTIEYENNFLDHTQYVRKRLYKGDYMPRHIRQPTRIQAVGTKPKQIEEFIGRINSSTPELSIARMVSPEGWEEPGQRPEFDEYTMVLKGRLVVTSDQGTLTIDEGQAVLCKKGEWVQYATPHPGGAEYIAVCLPAFSPELVHRDT
jgi:mannose-6-phosphate isomerase-like protein (cupin superfamily)